VLSTNSWTWDEEATSTLRRWVGVLHSEATALRAGKLRSQRAREAPREESLRAVARLGEG